MAGISWKLKIGYGMGHVMNDLCSSMWFSYLLLFYHKVLYFNNNYAGIILLVGQVADGLSTTMVGLLMDGQDNTWLCRKYGKRKSWHLVGSLCVAGSFPFIFVSCIGCTDSDQWAQLIYFSAFVILFQFGWACVQISHLSLIPCLVSCQNERTALTSIRYSMTVVSNLCVYLVALAIFGTAGKEQTITDKDQNKFIEMMVFCVSLGGLATLLFHGLVSEEVVQPQTLRPHQPASINRQPEEGENQQQLPVKYWFTEPQFYIVAVAYLSTRLFTNLSQAYIPLYIQESLELESIYIAIIPLIMYLSGFITSFFINILNRKAGRKPTYLIGSVISVCAAIWVYYGAGTGVPGEFFRKYGIFMATCLYGCGGSTLIITSLSLTADLIGKNTENSAFVYGAMSFTDKLSNGGAVILIQNLVPCIACCPECKWFYRDVLFFATGGAALLGAIAILALLPFRVGQRRAGYGRPPSSPGSGGEEEEGGDDQEAAPPARRRVAAAAAVAGESSERTPLLS